MAHMHETLPPGHPIQSSLEAIYARRGLPPSTLATLRGTLERVTLRATPDAPPLPLAGPLFLVHGTALPEGRSMQVMAVVSWTDQGMPRMLAGQLDDAISAGVRVILPAAASGVVASPGAPGPAADDGLPDVSAIEAPPWELSPPEPAPRTKARSARAARPTATDDSPHVDLSAEMAALTPSPASTPAPAPSKPAAPEGGGWAAAVAASQAPQRATGSRRPATASDLGFDVDGDPDLQRGDVLLHPRFGRCKVIKASDGKVKVRRATGAFIDLHLKVCHFTRLPDEGGNRVFDLRIGRH